MTGAVADNRRIFEELLTICFLRLLAEEGEHHDGLEHVLEVRLRFGVLRPDVWHEQRARHVSQRDFLAEVDFVVQCELSVLRVGRLQVAILQVLRDDGAGAGACSFTRCLL